MNGGHCLVQWTRCQRPKKFGGLGILDLDLFSRALRLRWLWFQWTEPERPWVGTDPLVNAVDRQLFRASTVVTLGDGATASFWQSAWLDGLAPMDIYPNLFKLAWRKNRTVKEELVNHNWTRGLWRMQSVQEMACFVNLWDAVQAIQLTDQPDSIRWKWTAHGDYSAKSAYNIQFAGSHGQFISSHIWQAESEGKHKFFTWLLVQSKLLTADNLLKRQWPCEPVCQLCSQEPETADHLILSCCFAKEVWHKMSQWTLGFITMPSTDVLVADWWQNELAGLPKKQRRVKAALLMYTAWNLWKERNRRIFEHVNSDAVRVMQEIKAEVAVRRLACGGPELTFTHD